MTEGKLSPHSITAAMRMVGRQRTNVSVQHPGTPEASITVAVGRSVVYLHTRTTAERLGSVWQSAAAEAAQLPLRRPLRAPSARPPDVAEPSVVVHAAGRPAGVVRLGREPGEEQGRPSYLHVQVGNLIFLLYDQRAFSSCAEAFIRASQAASEHLTNVDLRLAPVRREDPTLRGDAAERAAGHLRSERAHPALRAAAAYSVRGTVSRLGLRQPAVAPQIPQQPSAEAHSRLGLRKPGASSSPPSRGQSFRTDRGQAR